MLHVARYILSHRKRPPLGLGLLKRAKRLMGKDHSEPVYPLWLNESFAKRFDLAARWKKEIASEVPERHVRAGAFRRLTSPYWQAFLESCDAGVTFIPVEYRLPLLDVRLVNYAFAIPPLPWCVSKELLRTMNRGTLPEAVCRRPKSPLAFDLYQKRLQQPDAEWVDSFEPVPALSKYVIREAIPKITGTNYNCNGSWVHLRPLILNQWLQSFEFTQ